MESFWQIHISFIYDVLIFLILMIITISGTSGSGKSTVARLLAKKLDYEHYSMGDLSREIAQKKGMTIEQFNEWGKTNKERDDAVDDYQKELGATKDDFIIDGRLSFYFIPTSVKIYIDANTTVRAKRIFDDPRGTEHYADLEEALLSIIQRDETDRKRYLERYGVDPYDHSNYELIIDSTDILPERIVADILGYLDDFK
ncbi:hypothetical protein COT47_07485 [Candidatus Woesearchaeota archaeon CG08_land_8_20_14_0_20_43_7]|nr:MAG: hypothetical protein COT47_07485 [Candidatus Woesearchaeota archaeon CG08_land_8_20_14_0_20_43_7]